MGLFTEMWSRDPVFLHETGEVKNKSRQVKQK